MNKIFLRFSPILFLGLLFLSCQPDDEKPIDFPVVSDYSGEIVSDWGEIILKLSKECPGFSPPVVARAMGYIGVGLYESMVPGMPEYQSLQGQLEVFPVGTIPEIESDVIYNWDLVANATLAKLVVHVFPNASVENLDLINETKQKWDSKYELESQDVKDRSVAFGEAVGIAMSDFSDTDSYQDAYLNNFPSSYVPPTTPGSWVPTPPAYQPALQPYWKEARVWMKENVEEVLPAPPPAYSILPSSPFYLEAMEVYETVQHLTSEEKTIADFWSDDPQRTATPGGHSLSIALEILRVENGDLGLGAVTLAKLGIAVNDAFVSCWNAKYIFNLIRPITFIHTYIDPDWEIPLNTPPFPEYPSGHSVQSGAAAKVLTDLFGENHPFIDNMHLSRGDIDGSPRNFSSFYEFADEAAISRLYGGIHFRSAIEVGVDQGVEVGTNIGEIQFKR